MDYEKVNKFLKIFGLVSIFLSILEIIFIVTLHFTKFIIDNNPIFLAEFIYSAKIIPLSGTLLWIFVNISIITYLIFEFIIFKIGQEKKIETIPLAKLMVVLGMIILLGGFVKMDYLVLLGKTKITTLTEPIRFQTALYDFDITPFMPAVFWIYFISFNCYILISGLVVTGLGVKWILLLEEEKSSKE
ncbi:MAG: hypothetical protein ACFFB0_05900 [Promethearchaeota archaeon]